MFLGGLGQDCWVQEKYTRGYLVEKKNTKNTQVHVAVSAPGQAKKPKLAPGGCDQECPRAGKIKPSLWWMCLGVPRDWELPSEYHWGKKTKTPQPLINVAKIVPGMEKIPKRNTQENTLGPN